MLAVALAVTTIAQAFVTASVLMLPVLAPAAAAGLGVPARLIGWQVALVYAVAALSSALVGRPLQHWGPARCTQVALFCSGLGCAAVAAGRLWLIAVGSVLLGFSYGLMNPAATQLLNRLAPPARRNLIFSIKQSGVPLGGVLAGLSLPGLALLIGWRGAALGLAGLLVLTALGMQAFRGWDADRATISPGGTGGAPRGRIPGLLALSVAGALFAAMQLSLSSFTVTMLVEEFGWSAVAAGSAAAGVQATGAVARVLWALLADRWRSGPLVLMLTGLGAGGAALMIPLANAQDWPAALLLLLLCALGACALGWNGVMVAEAARLGGPQRAGEAVGIVLAATFCGVVLGPSALSLIVPAVGSYSGAFALLALSPLAGAGLIAWVRQRG
ncbi:MFS transporter [Roseomonas marmotae]|uniref:MFS transporter n=1 Tax=Roseomonas marmotae TaxID=2768161 RepID=A0ABS3KI93_9PROT|nr:MFS transporter [Roseomonas marmotae]MBO1077189.1 MFS transporter [Roseomonas marmotae]